ncbi:MAG TPA: protein kinase [Polyangia bacterium]|nr:protein kinase [Polyangia bacterium]
MTLEIPIDPGGDAPTRAPTDAELVAAFVAHKQDAALLEIVRRHQIPVYRRLSLMLSDPDDAEAVCARVFLVASQRLGEWSPGTDLDTWLLSVAAEVGAARAGEAVDPQSPRLVDPAAFFKHSVHRALHSLPSDEREILLAVDLEGQSIEGVATARTLGPEDVRSVLDRARQRFTEAMTQAGAPKDDGGDRPASVEPGEIIDRRYRVEALLGTGGMAAVFRAEHLSIKRKVALKTLHPTNQTRAMMRERFVREAEVLGKLAHPNFVDISDFGESNRGLSYLVMELLEGHPLSAEIRDGGRIAPRRALRIARQICNGLAFAHGKGIIHRDIKPDNVVVLDDDGGEGFAKILDLGVAAMGPELEGSQTVLYGTPAYMAPEQIIGGKLDGRTDLYALGVTLFEMLTGHLPFAGGSVEFLLAQHLTRPPPPLGDFADDLADATELQALVDACLAKDPEERVRDAATLARRIEALEPRVQDGPAGARGPVRIAPPVPSTSPAPVAAVARRGPIGWVALAAVVAAAVAYLLRRLGVI